MLFKLLLTKDSDKKIIKNIVRAETLGELSARQLDLVESMPSEVGLYYMHNKEGDVIYLGKSSNLKKRLNRHFIQEGEKARKLEKETKTVTFEKTGSELVALLKENEELQRIRPKYNQGITKSKRKGPKPIQLNGSEAEMRSFLIIDKGRELGRKECCFY